MIRKTLCITALLLLLACWFWPRVGGCSQSQMYQISESELVTLESHLAALEQNNETLKAILSESSENLTIALNALTQSRAELATLRAELTQCRIDAESAKKSLETANLELQRASESFKASEKEREKIEGRLRNQRTVWQVLACILAGVAAAR